ncbi:MAG: EamA family transporter [Wenzhouxiangella sp.]|nr:EamA family transporter [Wenzhouxiangella sp.]MDR9452475.1 EamA family transporter [Wenzhouxiangella sp.]
MGLLWLVTLGWAFSFSLIGEYLSGQVDDYVSVFIRTGLASLLFLPLMARRLPTVQLAAKLMAIGGLQIGLMYLFLFHAFGYLTVPEVLLFTILTPLYVTLIDELCDWRIRLPWQWWVASGLAVAGAAVIRWDGIHTDGWLGFVLVQAANACFAAGQVLYRRLKLGQATDQVRDFGFFFVGGLIVATLAVAALGNWQQMPQGAVQWGVLIWLGLGASGLGYLAWNTGARRVNTAQLAVMNNMLIPAGLLVNVVLWNTTADWGRLIGGGVLLGVALVWAHRGQTGPRATGQR